jgi:hypothetical protein
MNDFDHFARVWPIGLESTLQRGVQARMADPMWMLGLQHIFGEFWHDGGSTPVDVCAELALASPSRMRAEVGARDPVEIRLGHMPFESVVEQEPVYMDGLEGLRLRAELGLRLQRLLRAADLGASASAWATRCAFRVPTTPIDHDTREWFDGVVGRVPDARSLTGVVAQVLNGNPGKIPLADGELAVLKTWQSSNPIWLHSARNRGNWDPERLEYRCTAGTVVGTSEVVLKVPEYSEGSLDWYAFEAGGESLGLAGKSGVRRLHRLPTPVRFPGMPESRFWSFEPPGVNFDTFELLSRPGEPASAAAMMALEFALSYGSDWFQVPVPLEPHTICQMTSVKITDAFGDVWQAQRPAGRWNLFGIDDDNAPDRLSPFFVNASPGVVLESEPLEEVHFLRDEQANVAWAIEATVPHPLGDGRAVAAAAVQGATARPGELGWALASTNVPRNWFPLMPVAETPGRLALGTMWNATDARPGGRILAEVGTDLRIEEGEVPLEGVQVTRRWQAARATDGSLHFWIGRAKAARQTEIAPGVRFDVVTR